MSIMKFASANTWVCKISNVNATSGFEHQILQRPVLSCFAKPSAQPFFQKQISSVFLFYTSLLWSSILYIALGPASKFCILNYCLAHFSLCVGGKLVVYCFHFLFCYFFLNQWVWRKIPSHFLLSHVELDSPYLLCGKCKRDLPVMAVVPVIWMQGLSSPGTSHAGPSPSRQEKRQSPHPTFFTRKHSREHCPWALLAPQSCWHTTSHSLPMGFG